MDSKWTSRKFLLTVGSAIFMVLSEGLGLGISAETWTWFWGLIVAYIAAEGTADVVSRVTEAKK